MEFLGIGIFIFIEIGIFIFISYNLLKKNEKLEEIILENDEIFQALSITISKSRDKLKEIDEREIFSSDDELGFFIKELKTLQEEIDKYDIGK